MKKAQGRGSSLAELVRASGRQEVRHRPANDSLFTNREPLTAPALPQSGVDGNDWDK